MAFRAERLVRSDLVVVAPEVRDALAAGGAVVALETTLVAHEFLTLKGPQWVPRPRQRFGQRARSRPRSA